MYKPLRLIFAIGLAAAPTTAWAQVQARCGSDSLDPTQAAARLEWARKCGLLTNTNGPGDWQPSQTSIDTSFNAPQEYIEHDTTRAFSGNADAYTVNYQFARNLYPISPFYNATLEASGPTSGYWKWQAFARVNNVPVAQSPRPRPLYPTFGPLNDTVTPWFPHPSLLSSPSSWPSIGCELYTDGTGKTRAVGAFWVVSYCESSCYTPDQSLRFSDGDVNIVEALQARRNDLVTLSPDATLDAITTQVDKVFSYTVEIRDTTNPIVKVATASGGSLSVTTEHPVLTSKGRLVKAETLTVHDELLLADGTPDPITHVERSTHFGKVYNIKPLSPEPVSNILIAQGFLVGSARFQNDDVGYMNRILLFRAVPHGVIPK
ncbi:MAG TPA: Hint domain-containing protein [Kofleriaceae bacterium]